MRPNNSTQRWFAATVCVLATVSFAAAEEGVVRISDANTRPGVVRLNAVQRPVIQQTAYGTAGYSGAAYCRASAISAQRYQSALVQHGYSPQNPCQNTAYGYPNPQGQFQSPPVYQPISFSSGHCGCGANGCDSEVCDGGGGGGRSGRCGTGNCYGSCDGNYFPSGREARKMRRNGEECDVCLAGDYNKRMCTLFARACPDDGCTNWPTRWWRGQQLNFLGRNQRLSNTLFGWLVPSGCNGQGCPTAGCYNVTYADDPGYSDGRDGGMAYGAQGYGVPVNVPLAPNVRQSYNYSWGTPSSRITPMGNYSAGAGQQSPYQSW
jgi:hypothetical protein